MFAEHHGVVPWEFGVENGIAVVVPVGITAGQVKLLLGLPEVSVIASVAVFSEGCPKEVGRDVLDRIETQPIRLGSIQKPTDGTVEVVLDVFRVVILVLLEIIARQPVSRAEADVSPIRVVAIIFRVVGVAQELDFVGRGAFPGPEVAVGGSRLGSNVDEVGQSEVLNLPLAPPFANVVPFAVVAFIGPPDMKVLRPHPGIEVVGREIVEAWHVECPVVHDVVEVYSDPETVGGLDHAVELDLCSIAGAEGAALFLASQVERVPEVVAYRKPAASLGWGRQP